MTPDTEDILMAVLVFLILLDILLVIPPLSEASVTMKSSPRLDPVLAQDAPKGRWYLAASGRAVHCYGPVVKIGELDGLPHLYATRCLPGSMTVKLHE